MLRASRCALAHLQEHLPTLSLATARSLQLPVEFSALGRLSLHTSCQLATPSSTASPALSPQRGGYLQSGQQSLADSGHGEPRFLITGAGGQVGAALVPFLRQRVGMNNVLASDVRSGGGMHSDSPLIYCDVTDKDNLSRIVLENRITHVVHLATLLSAVGERNPQLALRVNTIGIQNVLDVAVQSKLTVFAPSTIAVFGSSTPRHNTPDATICEPSTMYGITKVHQELLGQYYRDKFGVDFRSLRYPGIISADGAPGGGTTDYSIEMLLAAAKGESYNCFISDDTHLPMMYMPDCLRATWDLMVAPREVLTRCTYNVTAMTFAPAHLHACIRAHYPDFQVTYAADFRQDIANTWPQSIDDSLARRDWGWHEDYNLEAMTEDMLRQLVAKHGGALPSQASGLSAQTAADPIAVPA